MKNELEKFKSQMASAISHFGALIFILEGGMHTQKKKRIRRLG